MNWKFVFLSIILGFLGGCTLISDQNLILNQEKLESVDEKSKYEVSDDFLSIPKRSWEDRVYFYSKVRQIVIDPGHGGKDPGAMGRGGVKEKKIVLDISRRLETILKKQGLKVKMTRDRDEFISLRRRTEISSRSGADLFVSIHANSSPVRSVHGVEVYALRNLSLAERNEAQRRKNHRLFFQNFSMKKKSPPLNDILQDMLYSHKQSESTVLAKIVAQEIAKFTKTKNLGVKQSQFYVLKSSLTPAILVEVGFLSNPKEGRQIRTAAYRQKIANGLARGILNYLYH